MPYLGMKVAKLLRQILARSVVDITVLKLMAVGKLSAMLMARAPGLRRMGENTSYLPDRYMKWREEARYTTKRCNKREMLFSNLKRIHSYSSSLIFDMPLLF
jgi:hypothetical protein